MHLMAWIRFWRPTYEVLNTSSVSIRKPAYARKFRYAGNKPARPAILRFTPCREEASIVSLYEL